MSDYERKMRHRMGAKSTKMHEWPGEDHAEQLFEQWANFNWEEVFAESTKLPSTPKTPGKYTHELKVTGAQRPVYITIRPEKEKLEEFWLEVHKTKPYAMLFIGSNEAVSAVFPEPHKTMLMSRVDVFNKLSVPLGRSDEPWKEEMIEIIVKGEVEEFGEMVARMITEEDLVKHAETVLKDVFRFARFHAEQGEEAEKDKSIHIMDAMSESRACMLAVFLECLSIFNQGLPVDVLEVIKNVQSQIPLALSSEKDAKILYYLIACSAYMQTAEFVIDGFVASEGEPLNEMALSMMNVLFEKI